MIPNSVYFNENLIAEKDGLMRSIPSLDTFIEHTKRLGIRKTDDLVCYDVDGFMWSPKLWFLFKYFGHEGSVRILNGELKKWLEEEREYFCGSWEPEESTRDGDYSYSIKQDGRYIRTLGEMHSIVRDVVHEDSNV